MRYLTFSSQEQTAYEVCFLVPTLHQADIQRCYIDPHLPGEEEKILAYDLYKKGKQTPVKEQREYLSELLPILADLGVKYLVTCDAEYFKTLTKAPSTENALGYVLDSVIGDFKVVYCPSFRSIFYNPEKVKAEIRQSLEALQNHRNGTYNDPGLDVIKFAAYPTDAKSIATWLQRLLDMDCDLAIDIEGFSLKHYDAGIGTISFAWTKHEGIAFPVDYRPIQGATEAPYGEQVRNDEVRALLKQFFQAYLRKAHWHNIAYDAYVLIYQLFMDDLLDTAGLLDGMDVLLRNWDCTKLISYLATNSCAGNRLGLKFQAQEFAGNYGVEEINDITRIPLDELLQYNLVDSLSTWFVYEKHWDTLIQDDQLDIYETLFKPATLDIIQMQLTGLPIDRNRVLEVQGVLQAISDAAMEDMQSNIWVQRFVDFRRRTWREEMHKVWKKKRVELHEVPVNKDTTFNPNSPNQLQILLFEEDFLGLPILDRTDTKLPATGADTLEKLKNHTQDPEYLALLQALIDFKAVDKILTSFIPAFLEAPRGPDGHYYLFGYFNLGGAVSGRLSSSNPNLQNLPANVFMVVTTVLLERYKYILEPYVQKGRLSLGKLIKSCFKAPKGWLFCGLDFFSLEDRISALTTKDPNKLKVYTDGYDGHCLRAYSYFEERMPDIDPTSVDSINSIEKKYPDNRQASKSPTFALTYQGTYHTLMNNCGFTEALAKQIESRYHELYRVSDQWVADRIAEAGRQGYITAAFGLRVRTPLLRQVVLGTSRTPYEAQAEGRTAGNALGQSWCLLNSRAASEFMSRVRREKYRLDIRPCAHIHDAQYYLIRDNMEIVLYVNEHLVRAVQWQDHPDIWHDEVKLGGDLSIFYPDWSAEMVIPNEASKEEIEAIALKHYAKYCGG